jgi:hypothetical protein
MASFAFFFVSARFCCSVAFANVQKIGKYPFPPLFWLWVGRTADPSRRPAYSPRSSSSDDSVLYAERGNPLALDALKSPTAANKTDGVPSDFDEPTDAEVGKWSFYERLIHYMDGEKISHSNCKAVELVILIEAGTQFYKEFHGEERYKSMIVNLLNQLPGVPKPAETESSTQRSSTPRSPKGMEVDLTDFADEDIRLLSAEE